MDQINDADYHDLILEKAAKVADKLCEKESGDGLRALREVAGEIRAQKLFYQSDAH